MTTECRRLSRPRHRSRSRRQDHRPMERVRRPGADGLARCCSHTLRPTSACNSPTSRISRSACCRSTSSPRLGGRRSGDLRLEDLRRQQSGCERRNAINSAGLPAPTAANPFVNVPTVLPSHWRFDGFAEAKVDPNVTLNCRSITSSTGPTTTRSIRRSTPFVHRAGADGASRGPSKVLTRGRHARSRASSAQQR